MLAICYLVCFGVVFVNCLPTVYKYNENKILELGKCLFEVLGSDVTFLGRYEVSLAI